MRSMWIPREWKKFIQWLRVAIFSVAGIGFIVDEIEATISVIYGGTLSFFYLFSLILLTNIYGTKIPLVIQLIGSLRFPATAFGLFLGHLLPIFILKWTILGFVLFYPLLFFYNKWESD